MEMQWYEVNFRDMADVYGYGDSSVMEEYSVTIGHIDVEDVDTDQLGNPVRSVSFVGSDAFVVCPADRPIQALLVAVGLLTPDRRKKGKDVCLI